MGNSENAVVIGYVGTDQCRWKSNVKIDNANETRESAPPSFP
jgi:hypothetical protein